MRSVRLTLLSLVFVCLGAAAAAAQSTGTVTGQVTDGSTGQPLAGVQMQVAGTNIGGLTDQSGRYLLTRVPAGEQTIRAILIGYSQTTETVTVTAGGTATADFTLQTSAVAVEGLVVTATGERRRTREVGASVGRINIDESVPMAVNSNVSSVLQGRSPGVTVTQAGGTTGTGSRIRIRGNASVSLNNDPLIIVDGVRASNSTGMSVGVGGQNVSRLDDFSPEDIEQIEVLKGPAASALYGTAAANGVIVITTKKGSSGTTRWHAYMEQGQLNEVSEFPANYMGWCSLYPAGAEQTEANKLAEVNFCVIDLYEDAFGGALDVAQDSVQIYNPLEGDHENNPFQTGVRDKYGLSASGGSDRVTYFLSGDFEREEGIYQEVSHLETVNLRANLSAQLTDNLDASVQSGWLTSDLRLPQNDNNVIGILPSAYLGGATEETAYGFFTLDELQAIDTRQQIERFTSSAQANFRPLSWLGFNGTAGMDLVTRFDHETIPPERVGFASLPEGQRTSNRIELITYTANLNASAEFELTPDLASSTDAGVQYNEEKFEGTFAFGRGLLAGCGSLNCVAAGFSVDEATTVEKLFGVYFSQQFSFADRLFATGTIRADDSSTFGEDLDLTFYPSANLSWVLDEEPWFPRSDALSLLRLRAGWGQSGLQPGFRAAQRFLSPTATVIRGQVTPAFTFGGIGNPDLKPEISTELEFGADIGLLNDRLGLELTYYNKKSTDALVSRDLAPSIGVATSQFVNIGEVENKGFEALVSLRVMDTDDVRWDASFSYSANENTLIDLGKDPATGQDLEPIIFGLGGNTQRHQEGYPLGAYFNPSYTFEDANGDGIIQYSEVTVSDTAEFLGSPFPGREMAVQTNMTLFGLVRISGLLDHKGDYKMYNATEDFRCGSFLNCRAAHANHPEVDATLEEQAAYVGIWEHGTAYGYVEDASFWKLRELSATILFPTEWAQWVGADQLNLTLAGRNLATWTDYSGTDPEINGGGTGSNFNTFDFFSQPPVRTLTARIDVSF